MCLVSSLQLLELARSLAGRCWSSPAGGRVDAGHPGGDSFQALHHSPGPQEFVRRVGSRKKKKSVLVKRERMNSALWIESEPRPHAGQHKQLAVESLLCRSTCSKESNALDPLFLPPTKHPHLPPKWTPSSTASESLFLSSFLISQVQRVAPFSAGRGREPEGKARLGDLRSLSLRGAADAAQVEKGKRR